MRHLMSIQDPIDFQNEYQVWDPKLKDMVFLKFGIEKDEYNNAANCHKLMEMEEVQAKMQEIEDMMDKDPDFRARAMAALQGQDGSEYPDSQDDEFDNNQFDSDDGVMYDQN